MTKKLDHPHKLERKDYFLVIVLILVFIVIVSLQYSGIFEPVSKARTDQTDEFLKKAVSSFTYNQPRSLKETDGVKHLVPLNNVIESGQKKDEISAITEPKFVSITEADIFLDDSGLGIGVSFNGVDRYYPFQILAWHEIVNDEIVDQPLLVTYCPLCGTSAVFEPKVNGQETEFGVSGKLWNANLVMYDQQTDSYWSQILGQSIVGSMAETKLKILPHGTIVYGQWKQTYPDGQVLSKDTGYHYDYDSFPYEGYDTNRELLFKVDNKDPRYHPKEPVFQIEVNGKFKIYPFEELSQTPDDFVDTVSGVEVLVNYDKLNQTIAFERIDSGEQVLPIFGYWFCFIAANSDAEIFQARELAEYDSNKQPFYWENF